MLKYNQGEKMKIETERLILREWEEKDIPTLAKLLNNYEIAKNLTVPYPYKEEDAKYFIDKAIKKSGKNCYYFAVIRKSDNKLIGGTSLTKKDDPNMDNGGIWLSKESHGQGMGTEVWTAMSKLWFEDKESRETKQVVYYDNCKAKPYVNIMFGDFTNKRFLEFRPVHNVMRKIAQGISSGNIILPNKGERTKAIKDIQQ